MGRRRFYSESGAGVRSPGSDDVFSSVDEMNVPGSAEVTMRRANRRCQTKRMSLMRGETLENIKCTAEPVRLYPTTAHSLQSKSDTNSRRTKRTRHSSIEEMRDELKTDEGKATVSMEDYQKLQKCVPELKRQVVELQRQGKDDALLYKKAREENLESLQKTKEQPKIVQERYEELQQRFSDLELTVANLASFPTVSMGDYQKSQKRVAELERQVAEQQQQGKEQLGIVQERYEELQQRFSDLERTVANLASFHKPKYFPPPSTTCYQESDTNCRPQDDGEVADAVVAQESP